MDVIELNNILIDVLPEVLNCIVIEYMMSKYTFKQIRTFECDANDYYDCNHFCIVDRSVYIYDNITETIKMKLLNDDELYRSLHASYLIYVYKNNIYVSSKSQIHIFDKKCKKINTITHKFILITSIIVVADKIFLCSKDYNIVNVINLSGGFIKNIKLCSDLFCVKVYNEDIYILTYCENIYKYSSDGDIKATHTYMNDEKIYVYDFFVMDDTIFVRGSKKLVSNFCADTSMCEPQDVIKNDVHIDRIEIIGEYVYMKNNLSLIYEYKITRRKNVQKIITKSKN